MNKVSELSPAKLNLALSVGALDAVTGMHPICSWMVTVDLFDELEARALPAGSLSRYAIMWHAEARRRNDINWPIARDLAVRAHLALEKHVGRRLPVQLKLEKRIPVGGGLGGGSSNAAAMLRAVNRLYQLGLSQDVLVQIGATLGSDVPFFIEGGSAIVSGNGDLIAWHDDAPTLNVVVVLPDAPCATPVVFRLFDELSSGGGSLRADVVASLRSTPQHSALARALFNDLTEAALAAAPSLRQHLQDLAEIAERPAHVTGSGSSLFIVCDDPLHAEALVESIERRLNLPAVAVKLHHQSYETIMR